MSAGILTAQTQTEAQFISSVMAAIEAATPKPPSPPPPIIMGGQIPFAHGQAVNNFSSASPSSAPVQNYINTLLGYVDGLKAAGAQRIEFNPGIPAATNPAAMAIYDALVRHVRELGLKLAINPEVNPGEVGRNPTFDQFQSAALPAWQKLAQRYKPDNLVIIHEPTSMNARLNITSTVQQWHDFVMAAGPMIKAVSPHTRIGAGAYHGTTTQALSDQEEQYFKDFVNMPTCSASNVSTGCLDFVTMDIYNDDTFDVYTQWAQMARAAGKGVYIEETWAPHYLPNGLPATAISPLGNLMASLDDLAAVAASSSDFSDMDAKWIQFIATFAASNGMESVTPFTTQTFFALGAAGVRKSGDKNYNSSVQTVLTKTGTLTAVGQAYAAASQHMGIKLATSLSNASYPTLPSIFNPNCGTATNPCNAWTVVAPDMLVSAFGADLATTNLLDGTFPTTLGGTTVTLIDSSNTSYPAPIFSVSPTQVNYYVPASVQAGPVTVIVTSSDGTVTTGTILMLPVVPGIYTANQNGKGVPAALAVCAGPCAGWQSAQHINGQYFQTTFNSGCTGGNCVPQPIDVSGPSDTVVLELYGTGLRHVALLNEITAQINGQNLPPVEYAGKSSYTGLDQINVPLPQSLAGSGQVTLVLTVQSPNGTTMTSNPVTLMIE